MGFCYFFWFVNTSILIWLAGVRGIFSMAFDRQLPLKLASVGGSGNPTWANHFLAIFAFIGVVMAYGDSIGAEWAVQTLALLDFGALFFIWPMGLAAIFLPYLRPDLFEKSTFQYTFGGVPVITIIGVACFLVGWWMIGVVGQYMVFWSYDGDRDHARRRLHPRGVHVQSQPQGRDRPEQDLRGDPAVVSRRRTRAPLPCSYREGSPFFLTKGACA